MATFPVLKRLETQSRNKSRIYVHVKAGDVAMHGDAFFCMCGPHAF